MECRCISEHPPPITRTVQERVRAQTQTHTHTHKHANTHANTHIHILSLSHTHTNTHTYKHTKTHTHTHKKTHTHTHTRTYTHTNTHTCRRPRFPVAQRPHPAGGRRLLDQSYPPPPPPSRVSRPLRSAQSLPLEPASPSTLRAGGSPARMWLEALRQCSVRVRAIVGPPAGLFGAAAGLRLRRKGLKTVEQR